MKEKPALEGTIWEAIETDNKDLFKKLVEADLTILRENMGTCSAHNYIGHIDAINCLKYLVEEVKINILEFTNIIGGNIFHAAAKKGGIKVFKYILDKKMVNIETSDHYGDNALHHAAYNGQIEIIKLLLEAGCNKNPTNISGDTPLTLAACRDNTEIVQLLLDAGSYINQNNNEGNTPLYYAVLHRNSKVIKLLLEAGCNKNPVDKKGNTPFHLAAFYENTEGISILVENGCNLTLNQEQVTPLDYIIENRNLPIFNFLVEKIFNGTLLTPFSNLQECSLPISWAIKAVKVGEIEMLKQILKISNYSLNVIDFSMQHALWFKNWDILVYLYEVSNLELSSILAGRCPIEGLLTGWGVKPIKWLLETNVIESNFKNKDNKTLLDLAIGEEDFEKIKYLFEKSCLLSLNNFVIKASYYEMTSIFIKEKLLRATKLDPVDIKILKLCQFILNSPTNHNEHSEKNIINDYISTDLIILSGMRKNMIDNTNEDPYTLLNLPQEIQKVIFNEVPLYLIGPGSIYLSKGKDIEIIGDSEAIIEDLI